MNFMETMSLKQFVDNLSIFLFYASAFFYITWGIFIIKEDFETGKIKNSHIILAFRFTLFMLLIQLTLTLLGSYGYISNYLTNQFYIYYFYNLIQSAIFSYILWYGEVWPAGDSKFYTANMVIIPLINPQLRGFPQSLWLLCLINIFIIAAFFSIYSYVKENSTMLRKGDNDAFKEIKEYYKNELKESLKLKPQNLFMIFSLFSVFSYKQTLNLLLQNYIFNIFHRTDIFFFLLYFLWPKISTMFRSKIWKYIMFVFYVWLLIYALLSPQSYEIIKNIIITAIKNTFKFATIFTVGKIIFEKIIEAHNIFYASKDEIKPGMILSSYELGIIKKNEVFNGIFDDLFKDGLSEEQVEVLKKWMENHPNKNVKLRFVRAKPFAFNIFIGCLMQIIINKNLLKLIL
ncbi:MAG: hypothetical protein ACP5IO_00875 [Elusimicrobiales bacterium]